MNLGFFVNNNGYLKKKKVRESLYANQFLQKGYEHAIQTHLLLSLDDNRICWLKNYKCGVLSIVHPDKLVKDP